jgi:hypothetical protein
MARQELQVGDEIIPEGAKAPLIVVRVGEKRVWARFRNIPYLLSVDKDKIIWRTGQPPEQIMRSLRHLEKGYEPRIVVLKKKRQLREIT